jgi:hypothetical protein
LLSTSEPPMLSSQYDWPYLQPKQHAGTVIPNYFVSVRCNSTAVPKTDRQVSPPEKHCSMSRCTAS